MEQYSVTGMTCAACQARVEKVVSNVPGVTVVSVSLLTNSMGVEGTATSADIVAAVEKAGYHASVTDYFSYLFDAAYVPFYGTHDVELAVTGLLK